MRTRICGLVTMLFMTSAMLIPACCMYGQDTAPAEVAPAATPVAPAPVFQAPAVTPDTEIFKRTPIIDGVVEDGEWDVYYSFNTGDWQITTYADWDKGNLYVAAKSNRPIDLLTILDADNDGWFHGDDNYDFRAIRTSGDSLSLAVARYESRNTKSPVASPVSPQEASLVEIKSTRSEGAYMIEMRIPGALVKDMKLNSGRKIGFQIAVKAMEGESGWVPNAELGDTKECRLTNIKVAALKPLELGFDLRTSTIARGDELVGKFHITNAGNETIDVQSFVVAGEGKAGEYMGSEKVRVDKIDPKKHMSHEVRSVILSSMRTGSWAMGAEVRSASGRIGSALVSFDVVEPFEVELKLPEWQVRTDVKDVTFGVVVINNRRDSVRGKAKITLPTGWELWRGHDTFEFIASGMGNIGTCSFKAKPPLGALGDVPVKIDVTVDGITKTVEGKIVLVNP
ncbi:MAG: hypothetical protein ABFD54_05320 [Armatimonadota bacterium]|nr:hypothetical protein [bacterium]